MIHGFLRRLNTFPAARQALAEIVAFLERVLA